MLKCFFLHLLAHFFFFFFFFYSQLTQFRNSLTLLAESHSTKIEHIANKFERNFGIDFLLLWIWELTQLTERANMKVFLLLWFSVFLILL